MTARSRSRLPCWLLAGLALALTAEGCPDPDARYEAFLERSADMRGSRPTLDGGQPMAGERFDFSDRYVLALSVTLSPGKPLLLDLEADVDASLERFTLRIQPLSTPDDDVPLEPVGQVFLAEDVPYPEDGEFLVPPLAVTVPGRANPISGSSIVAEVSLSGSALPALGEAPRRLCGEVDGTVSEPLAFDLAGSTFGALPTEDFDPEAPLTACP